jgi:hypothetical protein
MKKILATILVLSLLLNTTAFANETTYPEFILGEHIKYHVNESQNYLNEVRGVEYPVGTAKVEDVLYSETNRKQQDDREFSEYMRHAATLVRVITTKFAPQYSSLAVIFTTLGIISKMDTGRQVTATTWQTTRWFYHNLYVYNDRYTWEDVGYSRSKYYYRHMQGTFYNEDKGEWDGEYKAESHQNGYAPFGKDLAPHYKKYIELENLAYNAWKTGRDFYESGY